MKKLLLGLVLIGSSSAFADCVSDLDQLLDLKDYEGQLASMTAMPHGADQKEFMARINANFDQAVIETADAREDFIKNCL